MKAGANYPEYAVRTTTTGAHFEETHTRVMVENVFNEVHSYKKEAIHWEVRE